MKSKKNTPIIYSIIATYNRLPMLKLCIKSLLNQEYPLKKIIIVDNKSTDGTFNYLHQISKKHKNLIILQNKNNLGMASAINLGLKRIMKEDWDYVWITDDDNIAEKNSLLELVNKLLESRNKKIIYNSLLLENKNKNKLVFSLIDLNSGKRYEELSQIESKTTTIEYCIAFNFTLLPKKIFSDVGLLDENYFIRGEEIDFITNSMLKNYELKIVTKSYAYCLNQRQINKFNFFGWQIIREDLPPLKLYYVIRNTLFLVKKYQKTIANHEKKGKFIRFFPYYQFSVLFFLIFYFFYVTFVILFIERKNIAEKIKGLFLAYYHFLTNKKPLLKLI